MNQILVPIEFSTLSMNALEFALKIALATKGKIILLHSSEPIPLMEEKDPFPYSGKMQKSSSYKKSTWQLNEMAAYVREKGVSCRSITSKGILIEDIQKVAEEEEIDLIVTGTAGAEGLDRFLFGTNSVQIFEHVQCPVLFIPSSENFHGIRTIVYATDFHKGDIKALKKIILLARSFDAEVIITHINRDTDKIAEEEENLRWMIDECKENNSYDKVRSFLIHHQDEVFGLEKSSFILQADIVCMSSTRKNILERIFFKSDTEEMAYHPRIPLLAIHLA